MNSLTQFHEVDCLKKLVSFTITHHSVFLTWVVYTYYLVVESCVFVVHVWFRFQALYVSLVQAYGSRIYYYDTEYYLFVLFLVPQLAGVW